MLSFLKIENLAIIDSLSVEFASGFNVLTGETGAGKSILVDALALLLGARGSPDQIRTGSDRLSVEGAFEPDDRRAFSETLQRLGLPEEGDAVVLRREITSAGRSRAFVNGALVTLQQAREIGGLLADIHGQHEHQSLLGAEGQREALDGFGALADLAAETSAASGRLRALLKEREDLRAGERARARREDALRSEIAEIDRISPAPGEEEDLRRDEGLLRHAEEVRSLAAEIVTLLNEDDASVLSRLGVVRERLMRLSAIDPRCADALRASEEARLALKEALRSVEPHLDPGDESPARLEAVATRLAAVDRLKRKFGASVAEVLSYRDRAGEDLAALGGAADRLLRVDSEVAEAVGRYAAAAGRLSRKRREAARALESAMKKELKALAMEGCRFTVAFTPREDETSEVAVDGRRVTPSRDGVESIEFLISPNPGEEARPLAKVASGGELSRLMLALRAATEARGDARTVVFDEVDAGIGGPVAEQVAAKLKGIARRQQVLCVTHLPQIAAAAGRHLRVEKAAAAGRTRVTVQDLSDAARVDELARMIGSAEAPTARRHAASLIQGRRSP